MKVKSPLRLAVSIVILLMIIYAGYAGAVSIMTGKPVSFGFWSRSGTAKNENAVNFVVAGTDKQGFLTDLILLCRYDAAANTAAAIQIPRDTKVDNKRYDKKINSAYGSSGGIETMYDEIESVTGIRPEKYVIVSFEGFRELIDAIGGVEFDVPMRMYYTDPVQNLVIDLQPGKQLLDGRHAEMFMRFRSGYTNGDIDRNAAQKEFYQAALDKLLSGGTVLKAPKILGIVNKNVKTDFSGSDIMKYIGKIPKLKKENIHIASLPGEGGYEKNKSGQDVSYFFYDKDKTAELIKTYFSESDTERGAIEANPMKNRFIKVRVIDATSIKSDDADVLKVVSEELSSHGFTVVSGERADRIRDNSELVNHNAKCAAEEIKKVYDKIPIAEEIEEYEKKKGEKSPDVTLIIGNDFSF